MSLSDEELTAAEEETEGDWYANDEGTWEDAEDDEFDAQGGDIEVTFGTTDAPTGTSEAKPAPSVRRRAKAEDKVWLQRT